MRAVYGPVAWRALAAQQLWWVPARAPRRPTFRCNLPGHLQQPAVGIVCSRCKGCQVGC